MLSIAQAIRQRGASGTPLPAVYRKLREAGVSICRSEETLLVGPPSAGKSLLAVHMLAEMRVPTLAFLLDSNPLSASARFLAASTRQAYKDIKQSILAGESGIEGYRGALHDDLSHIQAVFRASGPEDIELEVAAFTQRYGLPPEVVLIDNIGNLASALENEWAASKALTLELDALAKREECAVIATAHTADLGSAEPARRKDLLGKISQYPALILSVAYDDMTGEFRIAVVKNREGSTDVNAVKPVILYADPARMQISEYPMQRAVEMKFDEEELRKP